MSPVATYIVETFVTLVGIVVLAVVVLYGGRRLGVGRPSGPLELVGRLPLDARRAVYLVRVGKLVYVVGASEAGLTRLGELDAEGVPPISSAGGPARFGDILARVIGGKAGVAGGRAVSGPSSGGPASFTVSASSAVNTSSRENAALDGPPSPKENDAHD